MAQRRPNIIASLAFDFIHSPITRIVEFSIAGGAKKQREGERSQRPPPLLSLRSSDVDDYFASGSGRSWKCTSFGFVPAPPSWWNGARVPDPDHRPLPFQPVFGSSIRPSTPLA